MQTGIVIKALNGYYYVQQMTAVIVCKLRGRLKKERYSLTVGDRVQYEILSEDTGIIEAILPRKNLLQRPLVANIDQVILTFAAAAPDPHPLLLDRFLVLAEYSGLEKILICINKADLSDLKEMEEFFRVYADMGYEVLFVSAKAAQGIDALKEHLQGCISVFAGPSGVGKSTLLNALDAKLNLETGAISEKIKRGKHTTRLAQLLPFGEDGFVVDTPGFSATEFLFLSERELAAYFKEFRPFAGKCRYATCIHDHEPQCAVKTAVAEGTITQQRYDSYCNILNEIRTQKRSF